MIYLSLSINLKIAKISKLLHNFNIFSYLFLIKYLCSDPVLREEYDKRIKGLRDIVTVMEDKFQEGIEKRKEEGIDKNKKRSSKNRHKLCLNMSKGTGYFDT